MSSDVGLSRGAVKVVDYNPNWAKLFQDEKQRLQMALGNNIHSVEHVGSTAVPGLAAKPIIDIIASVDDLSIYKQFIEPLTKLGYEYMPDRVFSDRVFFPKGARENRTYHLSIVLKNSKGWQQPITFRDYLIAHPEARQQYQTLKEKLAKQYADNRESYTKAKAEFIKQILLKGEV